MIRLTTSLLLSGLLLVTCGETSRAGAAGPSSSPATPLLEISPELAKGAKTTGGRVALAGAGGAAALRITAIGGEDVQVVITPPGGPWELSARDSIVLAVQNRGADPVTVRARAENAHAHGLTDACDGAAVVAPRQTTDVRVRLTRRPEDPGYATFKPFYMYSNAIRVRDNTIDPGNIARLVITIDHPRGGETIDVTGVRATGEGTAAAPPFFPFVDAYGQYIHGDWPGKIYSDADFAARRDEETNERANWPGPKDWDQYGGWKAGPTLKSTGFFFPVKHDGKWWLVDPHGRLFWSYGPTGVGFGGDLSPITDRQNWFAALPPRDSPQFGRFYKSGHGAMYMYYHDRDWLGFDVAAANLLRKYGSGYEEVVANLSHERLRSWGFNSMGNWSNPQIYLLRRTPYTVPIHYGSPLIHPRMPDVYDAAWESAVRAAVERERGKTAGDPWNIGYFIDNERWWGWRPRAAAVGEETLKNPADAPAKKKFIEQLKKKYTSIDALNAAWGTKHRSWDSLADFRDAADMKNEKVLADCGDFGMAFAERYFFVCRDAVKSVAPHNMYLGPRFNGHIDPELVKLAAKYCDVISYNIYDNLPDGRVNQYRALDVPIMATEWGIESDPLQTPFRNDKDKPITPAQRAQLMASYADHAIRHPNMVGAHFFQYRDQPLSGRPDGEAVLRGFVNIADTPSFELVQANRRVAYDLYRRRATAK